MELVRVIMKALQKAKICVTSAIEEEAIENQEVIQENMDGPSHGKTGVKLRTYHPPC
jgi:hypothetical protein